LQFFFFSGRSKILCLWYAWRNKILWVCCLFYIL